MGLFKKKEIVPEIQPAPTSLNPPNVEQTEKKELPELPSFPANPKNDNINQEMIRSAVSDMPSPGEEEVHMDIPKGLHVKEEQEGESKIPPKPLVKNIIPELPKQASIVDAPSITSSSPTTPQPHKPTSHSEQKNNESIFIRIDKFQSAQKNFEQIKEKVNEIESVLGKIKDIKSKEEVELKGWTEDVEKIKTRLSEIDADIFDQI